MSDGRVSVSPMRSQYRVVGFVVFVFLCFFFLLPAHNRSRISRLYEDASQSIPDQDKVNFENGALADSNDEASTPAVGHPSTDKMQHDPVSRPIGQDFTSPQTMDSKDCHSRFGEQYIQAFTQTGTEYCDSESTARLTCFNHNIGNNGTDSFCFGGPALFDFAHKGSIHLDCKLRDWTENDFERGSPKFSDFPDYKYKTGPKYIFTEHCTVNRMELPPPASDAISLLIQRENNNIENLWHTLMEIMSLTFSLDVLRQAIDPKTGGPYYSDEDIARSQAVFTDRLPHGPYWDLWRLFADKPSIRMTEISSNLNIALTKILVPLPGGSNPFWQSEWTDISCGESSLMKKFVQRVLDFYKIKTTKSQGSLTLTLIDRKSNRLLLNQNEYISAVKAKHSNVDLQIIDFAALPLEEQLRVAHETDVLVGVHGAGLAHGMFLPSHSAIVEILPPGLDHKGFANLARFLGHHYFRAHGAQHTSSANKGDWEHDDVMIEKETFLAVIDKAIESVRGS